MSQPIELNQHNFDDTVADHDLVLVDFWAPWCGPCKMVGPIMEQLAAEHEGKLVVGKVNVDENAELAARFRTQSIPTFLVFKQGELAERTMGAAPKAQFDNLIAKHA